MDMLWYKGRILCSVVRQSGSLPWLELSLSLSALVNRQVKLSDMFLISQCFFSIEKSFFLDLQK